jgi:capsular polysaccharide biosynthesis protein
MPASFVSGATRVVQLSDVVVEAKMCVAITADDRFVADTMRNRSQALENGYVPVGESDFDVSVEVVDQLDSEAVLVGLPCGGNYFHWMFEAVARALVSREHRSPSAKLLVPPLRPMERDALLTAGLPAEAIHELPPEGGVCVKTLSVPPRGLNGPHRLLPVAVDALHALAPAPTHPRARIYISRRTGRRRRIANEAEVESMLARHGFITVQPESFSVAEQISLFAGAEVIVTNHGGGLTNLVFAPERTLVVELQPPQLGSVRIMLFWNLAALRRQTYVQVVCPLAPDQETVPDHARDIVVDCMHLDALLGRHLGVP